MRIYHQRLATFYAADRALELGLIGTAEVNWTLGIRCAFQHPSTIVDGIEFVTPVAGTFKCSFWDLDQVRVREKNVVCPGPGVYQCLWDTPYEMSLAEYQRQVVNGVSDAYWTFGIYEVTGSFVIRFTAGSDYLWSPNVGGYAYQAQSGFLPNYTNPGIVACSTTGDAFPGDSGLGFWAVLFDPIFSYDLETEAAPPPGPWPCPPCSTGTPCSCAGYGSEPYGLCSGYGLEDCAVLGPAVDPAVPEDEAIYVPVDTNISFQITDDNAIVASTFKIYVDRGGGLFELAFEMTGSPQFKPGFDGPGSSITDLEPGEFRSYAVVLDLTTNLSRGALVRVNVEAVDSAGNPARIV